MGLMLHIFPYGYPMSHPIPCMLITSFPYMHTLFSWGYYILSIHAYIFSMRYVSLNCAYIIHMSWILCMHPFLLNIHGHGLMYNTWATTFYFCSKWENNTINYGFLKCHFHYNTIERFLDFTIVRTRATTCRTRVTIYSACIAIYNYPKL